MRYEAAAVIRAAEIEIKEYFAIFSEDEFNDLVSFCLSIPIIPWLANP